MASLLLFRVLCGTVLHGTPLPSPSSGPHHRHRHRYSKLSSSLRSALVSLHSCSGPGHYPSIGQPQSISPSSLDTSAVIDCIGDSAVAWL
ncbi:hypothetical protein HDV57DRAFT_26715 [Trichoderma longibrachiatum]|uniref:Secreted protein n=1 Tax=Trichoderma longibrachiatum ATCC 18648 TaxID=983965 RepID=A0A2T4CI86_TRILO|nr:hypothetical protein M440DRAFT_81086 [Trichoderma longibrachiatum ATCC 18648]